MLLKFSFKNFKSFRDDATLDLRATKSKEYEARVITFGSEKILPMAAIYGANAHGKSNVFEAFRYMNHYVLSSLDFGGDVDNKNNKSKFLPPTPFMFDKESREKETTFEVYFLDKHEESAKVYHYGFTVSKAGVGEEWLDYKTKSGREYKPIFYRNEASGELDLSGLPVKSRELLEIALEKETLIVSLGAKLRIEKLKKIREWFLRNTFADYGQPLENYLLATMMPPGLDEDVEVQNKMVEFLSAFDKSISGFVIELARTTDEGDEKYRIDTIHKMIDSDEEVRISLQEESSGTQKMFSLYPMLEDVLEEGGVLVVDELNSRLHPLLLRNILQIFSNREINKNSAQLIFTTHDVWQLSNNGLRMDEIWFVDKNKEGLSSLYSLADFTDESGSKIRKDENYEKNYLLGKYGAIPSIHNFKML